MNPAALPITNLVKQQIYAIWNMTTEYYIKVKNKVNSPASAYLIDDIQSA